VSSFVLHCVEAAGVTAAREFELAAPTLAVAKLTMAAHPASANILSRIKTIPPKHRVAHRGVRARHLPGVVTL
jgi:hypothetical protein